jgi:SAM-dependent methyltransferase
MLSAGPYARARNWAFQRKRRLPKTVLLAAHFGMNRWAWMRHSLGQVASRNGSTNDAWPLEQSLDYINRVFDDYLQCSNLSEESLPGMRILEVGPGDNLGVALKLVAAGADELVSIDKFFSLREPAKERRIYLALRDTLPSAHKARFDDAVDLADGIRFNPNKLRYVYGHGIEEAESILGNKLFDAIVSRAVLEEVEDLDAVFSMFDRLLRPGGLQIHRIDFRDYGMFSRHGHHPLEFLTIPSLIYRYASKYPRPNRLLVDYYRRKMEQLHYDSTLLVTRVCGVEQELFPYRASLACGVDYGAESLAQLGAMRSRLLSEYQALSDEDLMAAGIMLVANKPPLESHA